MKVAHPDEAQVPECTQTVSPMAEGDAAAEELTKVHAGRTRPRSRRANTKRCAKSGGWDTHTTAEANAAAPVGGDTHRDVGEGWTCGSGRVEYAPAAARERETDARRTLLDQGT